MHLDTITPLLALIIGTAGFTGVVSSLSRFRRPARLHDQVARDLKLSKRFTVGDPARDALELSARVGVAELASLSIVRPPRALTPVLYANTLLSVGMYFGISSHAASQKGVSREEFLWGTDFTIYSPFGLVMLVLGFVCAFFAIGVSTLVQRLRNEVSGLLLAGHSQSTFIQKLAFSDMTKRSILELQTLRAHAPSRPSTHNQTEPSSG